MKIVPEIFNQPGLTIAPFEVRNRLLNSYILKYCIYGHTVFIPVFFLLGRSVPLYVNIACVAVDLLCFYLNSKWRLKTVYVVFTAEICINTFVASLYFGMETGFAMYYIAVVLYLFLLGRQYIMRWLLFSHVVIMIMFNYAWFQLVPMPYPQTILPVWIVFAMNAAANIMAITILVSQFTHFAVRAEEIILRAKEKADEGERAKSVFLANMSYEIRSPLNSIIGMINLAMLSSSDEEKNEFLHTAKGSADHLLTVINDILDYSKIEDNRMKLNIEPFNIHHLVRNTMMGMDSSIYNKNLEMKHEISDTVPVLVKGDPARIRQVLINLLSNAVKFTEAGSITLVCSVIGDDEKFIRFSVEDTGAGIPSDKLDTIFDRFTQLEWNPAKKFGGTGLGLAISRELVELMGGNISVKSTPGSGSVFTFTVPLQAASGAAADPVKLKMPGRAAARGSLKVLIAEDIFTNWLLYEKYMNILGHSFRIVENGFMVLDELEQNEYDLVLMDL